MTVIVGQEHVVLEPAWHVMGDIEPVRLEQIGRLRIRDEAGVESQDHVRSRRLTFEAQAVQERDAIGHRDPFEIARALGLERFLDDRPRPPIGGEAIIGVDGQGRPLLREHGGCGKKDEGNESQTHGDLQF